MFGWRQSLPDGRDRHVALKLGAPLGYPDSASIRGDVLSVLDQGGTNACVAHGTAQAIRIAMHRQGRTAPLASRLAIYSWARAIDEEEHVDNGTYVRNAWIAMSRLGFPPESAWPFDEARVNDPTPVSVFQAAADQRWLSGYYRIPTSGQGVASYVRAAIAAGHPVVFGTQLDQTIFDLQPGAYYQRDGRPFVGGHCTCIVGYDERGVELVNSWGTGWCDSGFGRMSWAQITSDDSDDFWIAEVAPLLPEAAE